MRRIHLFIAIIIDKEEVIVPIVEGEKLRIYNTESGTYEEYDNPALGLTEGRRGATLRFAIQKGATFFASPPHTFCELSYGKAVEENIKFFHLPPGVSFKHFNEQLVGQLIEAQEKLPNDEIISSVVRAE